MSEACKNTSFSSPQQQLAQNNGNKLVFLDKKFKEAASSTMQQQHYGQSSSIVKIRPNQLNARSNQAKRLSCEELEDLKEKFVDFINLDLPPPSLDLVSSDLDNSQQISPPLPPPPPALLTPTENNNSSNINHRLSILSAESIPSSNESSSASSSLVILSSTLNSSNKPEPPQRTVSIRTQQPNSSNQIYASSNINSSSIYSTASIVDVKIMRPEDSVSIKSGSIYSSCRLSTNQHQNVRNSRSVFSIYEEESETTTCSSSSSSGLSSASSTSSSSSSSSSNNNHSKQMERLSDHEIKKIESMYRSIGSMVCVSPCTCDLYTTTSEQIASMLNNCWKLELSGLVPIWIYDTGFNLKRAKKLALMLVDRRTAFPLIQKPIMVTNPDLFRNPNGDKQLTFTLSPDQLSNSAVMTQPGKYKINTSLNSSTTQLVGLIQFVDFLCCHEFYKFYKEIVDNPTNVDLFPDETTSEHSKGSKSKKNNKSHSMMSLNNNRLSELTSTTSKMNQLEQKRMMNKPNNRYSEYISYSINYDQISLANKNTTLKPNKSSRSQLNLANTVTQKLKTIRTITKSCISNPCAFQHVNSLKSSNNDQIRLLIDNYSTPSPTQIIDGAQVKLRKK